MCATSALRTKLAPRLGAHAAPWAVLRMEPFQTGCQGPSSSPDALTVLTFEVK